MSHSVWIWQKKNPAITELNHQGRNVVGCRQNDSFRDPEMFCSLAARHVKEKKKKSEYRRIWMTADNAKLWSSFLLSLTLEKRREEKKNSFNLTVLPSIPNMYCTAGWPRHITQFLSDRFCFPLQSGSGAQWSLCYTPRCPPENEDRCFNRLKQFDLQVLFFSLAYDSSHNETHSRNNRHSVNSWKGTASFRWSQLLHAPPPPHPRKNNPAYRG